MSIVIAIIATIIAGVAVSFTSSVQQKRIDETNAKIATIQKALLDYRRAFNRLPCPADYSSYDVGDAYFGYESGTPSTCSGTPAATYIYYITGNNAVCPGSSSRCVFGGMVPVRTLGLLDEYAFDGWGRRILYNVDIDMVQTDAFVAGTRVSSVTYDVTNSQQRFTVKDVSGNNKTISAAYVLVSFGPNGHGAIGRSVDAGQRISSGSSNSHELENCDCVTVTGQNGTYNYTFYQEPPSGDTDTPTNVFDDIVYYATRGDLRSATE